MVDRLGMRRARLRSARTLWFALATRLALVAGMAGGCAPAAPAQSAPAKGGVPSFPLLPVDRLPGAFQWQQRVTARWPEGQRSFGAVLSKEPGELRLVGLGPMSSVGFVLSLAAGPGGPVVALENRAALPVPFDPRYILRDVQRVLYPWIAESDPPPSESSAVREAVVFGQRVFERWQGGELVERQFGPAEDPDTTVSYSGRERGQLAARRAKLENRRARYVLEIETLSEEALAPSAALEEDP